MKRQIKEIEREILRAWDSAKASVKGFQRIPKSYHFFTKSTEDGDMVFCEHCQHFIDMKMGDDGRSDFRAFIANDLDFSMDFINYATDESEEFLMNESAENAADNYVSDTAHRLASYIVRIAPMPITDESGKEVTV